MDVAIITTEYPPFNNKGGIATFNESLANLLSGQGHRVIIFTKVKKDVSIPVHTPNIVLIPFIDPFKNGVFHLFMEQQLYRIFVKVLDKYFYSTSRLIYYNILAYCSFRKYKKKYSFTVIHTPVLFATAFLTSLLNRSIPLVTHAQGPDELLQPFDSPSFDSRLRVKIESYFMSSRSAYIVCCSKSILKYLKNRYTKNIHKLVYIPNFIDTRLFQYPAKNPNKNALLFIGRLEYRKGPDLVLQAFIALSRKFPKLTLTFLGEDAKIWFSNGTWLTFHELTNRLDIPKNVRDRISFHERIDKRASLIRYLMNAPGIAVLPSRYEPFGFVYIETMLAGFITVGSCNGAGKEIMNNGVNGFLIEPKKEEIIETVETILRLKEQKLKAIVQRGRSTILASYDMSSVKNAYTKLYEKLCLVTPVQS